MKTAFLDRDGTIIKDYPDIVWKNIIFTKFLDSSILICKNERINIYGI